MKNWFILFAIGFTYHFSAQSVGIGTSNPDTSAILEILSSNKGFLPPRMSNAERDAIILPAEGLLISCVDCATIGLHQFINGSWQALLSSFSTGNYGTVVNPVTGKVWLDRNLGALQVATTSTDAASYGDLYQWGRGADGHQKRSSIITAEVATHWFSGESTWNKFFILSLDFPYNWLNNYVNDLWTGLSSENNPCPSGFRLPTNAEWNQERLTWDSQDSAGAFASPLKLPLAGDRDQPGGNINAGTYGNYWSSTANNEYARFLSFSVADCYISNLYRGVGLSVRCIKD